MKPISEPPALVRPDESVSALIAQAKDLCGEIRQQDKLNLSRAVEVGKLLVKLKELRHRTWEITLKEIGVSRSRAWEYIEISKCPARDISGCDSIREAARLARPEPSENGAVLSRAERLNIHKPTPFVLREPGDDEEISDKRGGKSSARGHTTTSQVVNSEPSANGQTEAKAETPTPSVNGQDRIGRALAPRLKDVFASNLLPDCVKSVEQTIKNVKSAQRFSAYLKLAEIIEALETARRFLCDALPYAVHEPCSGKGCKDCRNAGYVSEWRHKELEA